MLTADVADKADFAFEQREEALRAGALFVDPRSDESCRPIRHRHKELRSSGSSLQ
jgi:hypothetical protein